MHRIVPNLGRFLLPGESPSEKAFLSTKPYDDTPSPKSGWHELTPRQMVGALRYHGEWAHILAV